MRRIAALPSSFLPVLCLTLAALAAPFAVRAATLEGSVLAAGGPAPATATVRVYLGAFQLPIREATVEAANGPGFRFEGLDAGRYYLAVLAPGFTTQWYDRYDCPIESFCFGHIQPIDVAADETRSGLDFALEGLGAVQGRVTSESGQGLAGALVRVSAFGSAGVVLAETTTDAGGNYTAAGAPAENVIVVVHQPGFVSEYWNDVPYEAGAYAATPIPVAAGQTTGGIDFALRSTGRLRIQVVAAETGLPLSSPEGGHCSLKVIPAGLPGPFHQVYPCAADGSVTLADLTPGSYYVATDYVAGRANAVYGTGTCNKLPGALYCDLAGATPVEVRAGEDSGPIVLAVEKEVHFKGTLAFDNPLHDLAEVARVGLYDELGRDLGGSWVSPFTLYGFEFTGLAPGRYFLAVDGLGAWQSFAWPQVACNRWYCDPRRGQAFEMAAGDAVLDLDRLLTPIAAYQGCTASDTALCLNQGRFRVEATWRDFGGAAGAGTARQLTGETGYFYFFSPNNLEVMVKALNGCDRSLGHHFWVYGAGLTNVQTELKVTDTLTGEVKLYSNLLGQTFQPILDSGAFATCDAAPDSSVPGLPAEKADPWAASGAELLAEDEPADFCEQDESAPYELCLGGRFRVKATWHTLNGASGPGSSRQITHETGTFSFFSPENLELVVKVLDACHTAAPGRWVFASGLTDVEVELEVEDLGTGHAKTYHSDFGPYAPILDLGSFPCD